MTSQWEGDRIKSSGISKVESLIEGPLHIKQEPQKAT